MSETPASAMTAASARRRTHQRVANDVSAGPKVTRRGSGEDFSFARGGVLAVVLFMVITEL
ncbi:hypothetical protein QP118_14590, partial [Enterococcus faecalis]|nr:hypothetical protein [Enterococcus faecalis]